jgi:hypothetical protein
MKILNEPISGLSFADVVSFCGEGHIENTQLDYKKELPKNLAKHFASFSNTRGGVIIVGCDEDSKNGKPKDFIGIIDDGKIVDRIHQFASNVSPRPRYELHRAEDVTTGKMFVLIRIEEGDKTPYYVQNDPHVYIRTGNISDPIEQAGPEMLELLFKKRERAYQSREYWRMRSEDVLHAAIRKATRQRDHKIQESHPEDFNQRLGALPEIGKYPRMSIYIQPYYPFDSFCKPEEIKNRVNEYREQNYYLGDFPNSSIYPFQDGVLSTEWDNDGIIDFQQLYSYGLIRRDQSLHLDREGQNAIYLSHVASYIWITLQGVKKFYELFKYHGVLEGSVSILGIESFRIYGITPSGWHSFGDSKAEGMMKSYLWPFEIETSELSDDRSFQTFYVNFMKEIYWSFGLSHPSTELLEAFFREMHWNWIK